MPRIPALFLTLSLLLPNPALRPPPRFCGAPGRPPAVLSLGPTASLFLAPLGARRPAGSHLAGVVKLGLVIPRPATPWAAEEEKYCGSPALRAGLEGTVQPGLEERLRPAPNSQPSLTGMEEHLPPMSVEGTVKYLHSKEDRIAHYQVSLKSLRLRDLQPGQESVHIGNGFSFLPVAEALMGLKVSATDADVRWIEIFSDAFNELGLGKEIEKHGGSFDYTHRNDIDQPPESVDHVVAIDMAPPDDDRSARFPLREVSENTGQVFYGQWAQRIVAMVRPGGTILVSGAWFDSPDLPDFVRQRLRALEIPFKERQIPRKLLDASYTPWLFEIAKPITVQQVAAQAAAPRWLRAGEVVQLYGEERGDGTEFLLIPMGSWGTDVIWLQPYFHGEASAEETVRRYFDKANKVFVDRKIGLRFANPVGIPAGLDQFDRLGFVVHPKDTALPEALIPSWAPILTADQLSPDNPLAFVIGRILYPNADWKALMEHPIEEELSVIRDESTGAQYLVLRREA